MDRDLVSSAQRGDRSAFVELMNPRVDALFALAQRILRDVDRAEDALQDALVIAWRDQRGLRDPDRGLDGSVISVGVAPGWKQDCPFIKGIPSVPLFLDDNVEGEPAFWA